VREIPFELLGVALDRSTYRVVNDSVPKSGFGARLLVGGSFYAKTLKPNPGKQIK
jgi:hypothetical protein